MAQSRIWWRSLQRTYAGQNIEFRDGEINDEVLLPLELFDSAADNLIQNALSKRKLQRDIAISVSFGCGDIELSVSAFSAPDAAGGGRR